MEWSTVIFLGTAIVSGVIFMGILILGTRKTSEYKEMGKILNKKAKYLDSDTKELWKALKESEEEKGKIMERLQNLEAIVTSEAYESITSGEDVKSIQLHLEDEKTEELNDTDKTARIAKRVR